MKKKTIIESNIEPSKEAIWLSPQGIKRYSRKGWEVIGGGSSNNSEEKIIKYEPIYEINESSNTRSIKEIVVNDHIVTFLRSDVTDDTGWHFTISEEDFNILADAFKGAKTLILPIRVSDEYNADIVANLITDIFNLYIEGEYQGAMLRNYRLFRTGSTNAFIYISVDPGEEGNTYYLDIG